MTNDDNENNDFTPQIIPIVSTSVPRKHRDPGLCKLKYALTVCIKSLPCYISALSHA